MLSRGLSRRLQDSQRWLGGAGCTRRQSRFAYPEGMRAYEDEYTEKPEYPPIDPEVRHLRDTFKKKLKSQLEWHSAIRNSATVEEKLIQLNISKKYGWNVTELREHDFGYNCLPYYAFITRTHIVPGHQLPPSYLEPELCEKAKLLAAKIKEPLKELLRFEFEGINRGVKENRTLYPNEIEEIETTAIVNQVNRLLIAMLAEEAPHLKSCQVDFKPKLEAFWTCGGLEAPRKEARRKERIIDNLKTGVPFTKDDPVNRNFQYLGSPILQIRSVDPLNNFVEANSDLCKRGDSIPDRMRYSEKSYGLRTTMRYATVLNGHWLGDDHRSSLLSIHPQHHLRSEFKQNQHWIDDASSALDSQAVLACFSRLLAQSYNYGFDQYSGLDYPFATQYISTNGLAWSFYSYQLNTISLDLRSLRKNEAQNICWGTKPLKIMDENNELNPEVVETLIKFYLSPPIPVNSPKGNATPYISEKLNDMSDELRREFIFENLRDMYMHKNIMPEKNPFPEIYDWEKIYKVYFKTMPMEPRRRWFELPKGFPGSDPYNEPYKLRDPQHIPKALIRYRRLLKEKKQADAMEAARKAEKERFDRGFDPSEEE